MADHEISPLAVAVEACDGNVVESITDIGTSYKSREMKQSTLVDELVKKAAFAPGSD